MSESDTEQQGDADSYQCEECGACFNTILERWTLPKKCWRCGACRPWKSVGRVEYVPA
jgi:hypothetical protein